MPALVVVPVLNKPVQGKGKPQYGKNGTGGRDLNRALLGGGGGIHGHVITKALTTGDKKAAGVSAGVGTVLAAPSIGRAMRYGRAAGMESKAAKVVTNGPHLARAAKFRGLAARNVGAVAASAGLSAGLSAGASALYRRHQAKAAPVVKMTNDELNRRRKVQANISNVTSTIGLTALGTKAGSAGLRKLGKLPHVASQLHRATVPLLTTGAGIGGAGGFNFASIQRAESRKKVQKAFDSERSRHKRNKVAENVLTNAGGGAALGGGIAAGLMRKTPQLKSAKGKGSAVMAGMGIVGLGLGQGFAAHNRKSGATYQPRLNAPK